MAVRWTYLQIQVGNQWTIEDITFEQAWKASGLSSNMDDYFDIDEAVLVELPD